VRRTPRACSRGASTAARRSKWRAPRSTRFPHRDELQLLDLPPLRHLDGAATWKFLD
jgi:hypothetical protein